MMYGRRAADGAFDGVCPPPGERRQGGPEGRMEEEGRERRLEKGCACGLGTDTRNSGRVRP